MNRLSQRVAQLQASPIREILAVIEQPGMISFAGGLPAPETFIQPDTTGIPASFMQYGASEGEWPLRQLLAAQMQQLGLQCSAEQVLILSGSQQGIDLVAKLFIDAGTPVAVESPTYLAALQMFRFFGAKFLAFDPEQAHTMLEQGDTPAFVYAIPSFQNPTGKCYSLQERQRLARLCDENDIVLFEDDPYRDLVYAPCDRTPICSLLGKASWVYQGSFSKTFAPGLRLGFLVCSKNLLTPLIRLKQATDLHSNRLSQWLVMQLLQNSQQEQRLARLVDVYLQKRDHFAKLLDQYFSAIADWQIPSGGLFFWLQLKTRIDTSLLLKRAIDEKVAFMPGDYFFPVAQSTDSYLRLNFSHASAADAEKGLAQLAAIIRNISQSR